MRTIALDLFGTQRETLAMKARSLQPLRCPLAKLRSAAGLTQFDLAVRSGLSLPTVSLAERTGCATPATAARLAEAFGIPVDRILRVASRRASGVPVIIS